MCHISANEDMQSQLRNLAQEVVSDIAAADPARSRELLSAFVSELVLAVADESRFLTAKYLWTLYLKLNVPKNYLGILLKHR